MAGKVIKAFVSSEQKLDVPAPEMKRCPQCGSAKITFHEYYLWNESTGYQEKRYYACHCLECGHRWDEPAEAEG
ncbi:MAG: hypothetical protein QXS54_08740 [Candidatus Methanomethylicaceae archaeon]